MSGLEQRILLSISTAGFCGLNDALIFTACNANEQGGGWKCGCAVPSLQVVWAGYKHISLHMAGWVAVDGLLTACLPAAHVAVTTHVCVLVLQVFYCYTLTFSHFSTFLFRCNVNYKTHIFKLREHIHSSFILRHVFVVATEARCIKHIVAYNSCPRVQKNICYKVILRLHYNRLKTVASK